MNTRFPIFSTRLLLLSAVWVSLFFVPNLRSQTAAQGVIREVKVAGSKNVVEIEVQSSNPVVPQTQVLTGPDRLVVDFPNSVPGDQVRSQSVNRGEVKDVRVGRFQANPPVTRVVLDLRTAQSYQVFPYGRTVMIKVLGNSTQASAGDITPQPQSHASLVTANFAAARERIQPDASQPLNVTFRNGLLTIHANKATLSQVLYAVQQRTGADISTPAGAEQEKIVADLGPAPAQEVLAHLLNGSRFNFLILNAANDPQRLDRVILSPRVDGTVAAPPPVPSTEDAEEDQSVTPPPPMPPPPPGGPPAGQIPNGMQNLPPDENSSDQ